MAKSAVAKAISTQAPNQDEPELPATCAVKIVTKKAYITEGMLKKERPIPGVELIIRDAPTGSDYIPGFGVRFYPSGDASYFIQRKVGGRPMKRTVGHISMAVTAAREKARRWHGWMRDGNDPLSVKEENIAAEVAKRALKEDTFGPAFDVWLAFKNGTGSPRSDEHREGAKKKLEGSKLWTTPLHLITLGLVDEVIYPIYLSSPASGMMCYEHARAAYEHAALSDKRTLKRGPDNPFVQFRKFKKIRPPERATGTLKTDATAGQA